MKPLLFFSCKFISFIILSSNIIHLSIFLPKIHKLLASCFEESRKLVGACILSLYSSLYFFVFSGYVSCRHRFSPVICFRQLPFCRGDFPLNDVTVYLDLSFDRAIDFPIYLMKFVDQNAQIKGKLLVIIKHNAICLFSAISNFLMH